MFLIISSCKKDEEPEPQQTTNETEDDNENDNNQSSGTFNAVVSGDLSEELSGMAWFEKEFGEITLTMWADQDTWQFTTFNFKDPVSEMTYTVNKDAALGFENDETNASAGNGDYIFFGQEGSATLTGVSDEQIVGEFNVDYQYENESDTIRINITGSFSADPD